MSGVFSEWCWEFLKWGQLSEVFSSPGRRRRENPQQCVEGAEWDGERLCSMCVLVSLPLFSAAISLFAAHLLRMSVGRQPSPTPCSRSSRTVSKPNPHLSRESSCCYAGSQTPLGFLFHSWCSLLLFHPLWKRYSSDHCSQCDVCGPPSPGKVKPAVVSSCVQKKTLFCTLPFHRWATVSMNEAAIYVSFRQMFPGFEQLLSGTSSSIDS